MQESNLNSFAFALPQHEEVLIFKSRRSQPVQIIAYGKDPDFYSSSAPEPAFDAVYGLCVRDKRDSRERRSGERGHRCGRGNGNKLHLVAGGGGREMSWEQAGI